MRQQQKELIAKRALMEISNYKALQEIPKTALAMERADVVDKLEGRLRMQFFKHSAKIMLYPDNSLVEHWAEEMTAFIQWVQVATLKPKNKRIDKSLLEYTFFNLCDSMETFETLLNITEQEFGTNREQRDNTELYKNFTEFKSAVINELMNQTLTTDSMKRLVRQYLQ